MKADLHIHSNFSDGSDSITQIIEAAKKNKIDAIAIMDHDTVSHLPHIPHDTDIQIIGGVEISAAHRETKTKVHILGYNIKHPALITELTQPLLDERNRNSEKQAEILIGLGYKIHTENLVRAGGKYLYKQHIMDHLVTTGQAADLYGELYQRMFKNHGPCAIDIEYIDVFDAIKTIKAAGGLAVLAHPGWQRNFWLVPEMARAGLDGIELNHHKHSSADREQAGETAKRYGLFMAGGSDYHGRYEPQPFGIGGYISHESGVEAVLRQNQE